MTVPKPLVSLTLISVLFFISCNVRKKSLIDELIVLDSIPPKDFPIIDVHDSILHKAAIANLVLEISTIERFESRTIGIESRLSKQPNYYALLDSFALTKELAVLANHQNPYVRICAFSNLCLRDTTLTVKTNIFKQHLNDKEMVMWHSGCVVYGIPVNIKFYSSISSLLNKKEKKATKEYLLNLYKDNGMYSYYINDKSFDKP